MTVLMTSLKYALAFGLVGTSALACADREAAIAAVAASNLDAVLPLQQAITIDPACDDAMRLWLDEQVARLYFDQAVQATSAGEKRALYVKSIDFFPHWRSYTALADLAQEDGNAELEAIMLQLALNQMHDGPDHHNYSSQEAQAIYTRAANALLLADTAVDMPKTRSGASGGIFIENLRGFKVSEVPLAIEYGFDSADLTEKGLGYAKQLLDYLIERTPPKIVLEGHTDPVGDAVYNDKLSLRRAESLRKYLIDNGYAGQIEVVGRGESDQPKPEKNMIAGGPEHHQIARRVVLIRG